MAGHDLQAPDYLSLEFGNIVDGICVELHCIDDIISVAYAPRAANAAAHRLAGEAYESAHNRMVSLMCLTIS